ncbi:hypothetical protein I4F81_005732 [Pyropia yezoensis]|uniref:Uncharacterized protein n=2 Tax=Pyropia yezoensis TaxID=2788 RepID=A0ACC3BZ78_PYRYE|nr:hypothetical protein I4F81_005731 [Neopyropia yezoensis]KAK1863170.1 hypothetical protein I4F81_005732 [Neopyropia yezoensis]
MARHPRLRAWLRRSLISEPMLRRASVLAYSICLMRPLPLPHRHNVRCAHFSCSPPFATQARDRKRPRLAQSVGDQSEPPPEVVYPSVTTHIRGIYEAYGDMARSTPLVKQRANSKAGRFNTRRLRSVQSFAFKTGGCGLSSSGNRDLWELFFEWESDRPSEPAAPRRLRDFFPTPHALQQALSDDIDEAVQREEWFSCRLIALDESFEGYYRSVLGVVLGDFKAASKVRKASRVRPGYLVKSDENQTSFTGREQRHGVWILAFLVAGLFDRQEPAEGLESGAASSGGNTTGASSEDDGDVAARRLLRSLCNVHGEAVDGEYDAGDGNENVEDEGDDDGGVDGSRCEFDWAVPKHVFFQARLGDGRRLRQVVRASEAFHGSEWYDYDAYRASGTESEYGQVRLLVRLDGGVDVAVVAE